MLQTLVNTFTPLLWGGVLALVLNLPLRAVEGRLCHLAPRTRRVLGLVLVLCGVAGGLFLGLWLLIPQLLAALVSIGTALPALYENLLAWLALCKDWVMGENAVLSGVVFSTKQVEAASDTAVSELMNMGVAAATYTAQQIARFAVALVLAVYLLASKENLAHKAVLLTKAIFGATRGAQVILYSQRAGKTFAAFMAGQCLEAAILAGLFVLVLFFTGMPYVLPIACVIGVTAFVPIFGSIVGGVFGFVLIAASAPAKAFWFVLLFILVQQLENNIIYPRVVGGRVGLPPLWVMLAIIIGGGLCGLPGLVLGIPAMSVFYQLGGDWVRARTAAQAAPQGEGGAGE